MSGKRGQKSDKPTELGDRYYSGALDSLDGRVRLAKAMREDLDALYADLGGKANVSYMEQAICQKVVYIKWMTGKKELTMARGGTIDEGAYYLAVNCLSGLLSKLGLKRRAKLLPSLSDYLDAKKKPEPQPAPSPAPLQEPSPTKEESNHGNTESH